MNTFTRTALVVAVSLIPVFASAATIVGGSSGNSGFLGVSSGGSSFGWSWGGGGGGMLNPAYCNTSICGVAVTFLYIINNILVPLLFAVAFIMFLYGVFKKYIWSHGDESKVEEGHKLILWGIIGFVVMVSLWGLVNVVANTFQLTGYTAPQTPTSYPSSL
jgi:hypothetical protein